MGEVKESGGEEDDGEGDSVNADDGGEKCGVETGSRSDPRETQGEEFAAVVFDTGPDGGDDDGEPFCLESPGEVVGHSEDAGEEGEHEPKRRREGFEDLEKPPESRSEADEAMEHAEPEGGAQAGVSEREEERKPGDGGKKPPADGWKNDDDKDCAEKGEEDLLWHRGLIEAEGIL